jgi:hypothetical protein
VNGRVGGFVGEWVGGLVGEWVGGLVGGLGQRVSEAEHGGRAEG